jgi:hypothetical protein
MQNLQNRVKQFNPSAKDSILERLTSLKAFDFNSTKGWLRSPLNIQQLHEYKELVEKGEMHPENRPSDSLMKKEYDLQIKLARAFITTYDSTVARFGQLGNQLDVLKDKLEKNRRRWARYQQMLQGKFNGWSDYSGWKKELDMTDPGAIEIPEKYKLLMGIRNFNVGKTPVNYSELSARNVSVSGVNFEYNSWYYLAVVAGVLDYRFRDFVVSKSPASPQYMFMVRLGLGRLEKNYFILSAFKGQKQLFSQTSASGIPNAIHISGFTAETKVQLTKNAYLVGELGQSLSPNYRTTPIVLNSKISISDHTSKALSFKLFALFPRLGARAEGFYKYTGANYQSFSSFQTNAAAKTWYMKWEQQFLRKRVRITATLRSNEFTNPYILQNYKSNTVFKSINAVVRFRKWPVITVGYVPMSQLSIVNNLVVENRFQTLTASANHMYKIGTCQALTTVVYNQFFNTNTDTGFIYYNATNFYVAQNLLFKLFTAGFGISYSNSTQYQLVASDINVRVPIIRNTSIGLAFKVNNLNHDDTRVGHKIFLDASIGRKDRINLNFEKGYLPGLGKQLVQNEMGTIQYSRYF